MKQVTPPSSFFLKQGYRFGKILCFVIGTSSILALSGCVSNTPPETFPEPDYSYLPTLNVHVNQVETTSRVMQDDNSLAVKSPMLPVQNLEMMAQQRLHPTGKTGIANFVINRTDITQEPHHILSATFKVTLTLNDPQHKHHGYVTATVSRRDHMLDHASLSRNLYELNRHMMDDMNVELEYQIRRNLSDWLTDAAGSPLNSDIRSQDLSSPTSGTIASAPLSNTQPPSGISPSDSAHTGILDHASRPGSLHLPQ